MYVWLLSFEPGPNPKISCVIRPEPENFLCYQARTRTFPVLSGPNPKILCYQARSWPSGRSKAQAWTRVDVSIQRSTPEHRHVLVRRFIWRDSNCRLTEYETTLARHIIIFRVQIPCDTFGNLQLYFHNAFSFDSNSCYRHKGKFW
jgi:hypothetical protein